MLKIPPVILGPFERLLDVHSVPESDYPNYKKWLRYYLDFCHKYNFDKADKGSSDLFINKLQEKKQSEQNRAQAKTAVSIYYNIETPVNKNKTISYKYQTDILAENSLPLMSFRTNL